MAPDKPTGEEDIDGKISRRGNCRRASACGFGTEFCRQTDTSKVTREECREFTILCGRARKFGYPRVWPRRPLCTWRELARPLVADQRTSAETQHYKFREKRRHSRDLA